MLSERSVRIGKTCRNASYEKQALAEFNSMPGPSPQVEDPVVLGGASSKSTGLMKATDDMAQTKLLETAIPAAEEGSRSYGVSK